MPPYTSQGPGAPMGTGMGTGPMTSQASGYPQQMSQGPHGGQVPSLWKTKGHGKGKGHAAAPPLAAAAAAAPAGPMALADLQQRVDQVHREKLALEAELKRQQQEQRLLAQHQAAQHSGQANHVPGEAEKLLEARGPALAERVRYLDPRVVAYSRYMDPDIPCPTIDAAAIGRELYAEAEELPGGRAWRQKNPDAPAPAETRPGDPGSGAKPVAFTVARPSYRKQDDVWERTLALRLLDEAVRGDVKNQMPAPAVFAEDYENYREGKYVKDDCWLA